MEVEAGITSVTTAALGEWTTGAEPSVMTTINETVDPGLLEYIAAAKGLTGNQLAVLDFKLSPDGTDNIYRMELDAKLKNLPGYLLIKYFPTKSASTQTLAGHIKQMELAKYQKNLFGEWQTV